jgi:hypothetical protein
LLDLSPVKKKRKKKEKTFILRFPKHPEKKRKGRKQNNKK